MADASTDTTSTDSVQGSEAHRRLFGGGQNISDIRSQSQQNAAKLQEEAKAFPGKISAIRATEQQAIDARPAPKMLTPEEAENYFGRPAPTKQTSLVEQWGSPAMLLALLGSAFTRQPLTNALNAGGAVMKAFQKGDFDAAQQSMAQWKENTDLALKLYGIQSKSTEAAWKAIREGSREAINDAKAELLAYSHAYGDQATISLLRVDNVEKAEELYRKTKTAADNLDESTKLINDAVENDPAVVSAKQKLTDAGSDPTKAAAAKRELGTAQIKAFGSAQRTLKGEGPPGGAAAPHAIQAVDPKTGNVVFSGEATYDAQNGVYTPSGQGPDAKPLPAGLTISPMTASSGAPSKVGTEAEHTQNAVRDATEKKGEPLTTEERGRVEAQAHSDWAKAGATGRGEAGYDLSQKIYGDDTISMVADSYIAGNDHSMVGMARGAVGQVAMARVWSAIADKLSTQEAKEFQEVYGREPDAAERKVLNEDRGRRLSIAQAEFQGIRSGERTAFTRAASLVSAAAEAKQFTPQALETSAKVNRTDYPTINAIEMAVKEGVGNKDVVDFHVANLSLADAFAQVVGRGNSQLTDAGRAQAISMLNKAWSEGQYETAVRRINLEIDAAQKAPEEVVKRFREGFLQRPFAAPTAPVGAAQQPGHGAPPTTGGAPPWAKSGVAPHVDAQGKPVFTDGKGWFYADHSPVSQ